MAMTQKQVAPSEMTAVPALHQRLKNQQRVARQGWPESEELTGISLVASGSEVTVKVTVMELLKNYLRKRKKNKKLFLEDEAGDPRA